MTLSLRFPEFAPKNTFGLYRESPFIPLKTGFERDTTKKPAI